jgi:ferredoxin
VKVHIDAARCQGHGRCYDLAPEVFGEDEEGYGHVLHGGLVATAEQSQAALAVTNCPERAIEAEEAGS